MGSRSTVGIFMQYKTRTRIYAALLALGALAILLLFYFFAKSVWYASHPQTDNALWGQRGVILFYVLCPLTIAELVGFVFFLSSLEKPTPPINACPQCHYTLDAAFERCPECGRGARRAK